MIANFLFKSEFTIAERFLLEKILELLHNRTLDSYRSRLHNPKTIIKELLHVLNDWHNKKIKQFETTVDYVKLETIKLLEKENELIFETIEKRYFKKLLSSVTKDNYLQLAFACRVILENNNMYCNRLFEKIKLNIVEVNCNTEIKLENLEELNRITDYLVTDLQAFGYAKSYLYKLVWDLFKKDSGHNFNNAFEIFESLSTRDNENFTIIFSISIEDIKKYEDLIIPDLLSDSEIDEFKSINKICERFFSKTKTYKYIKSKTCGCDYISVVKSARSTLSSILDLVHLGYDTPTIHLKNSALVIGDRKKSLANIQPVSYHIDGSYKTGEEIYKTLISKVASIEENRKIGNETKQKIISAIRYLRLGSEAIEIEQKFINYWIGIEYVFSNYDAASSTFSRLKDNFINAHSLIYIKRNLREFHNDIKRLEANVYLPDFNENLEYLLSESNYDILIDKCLFNHPLLSFRAYKFKESLFSNSSIFLTINKHVDNLKWHLSRAYRIRNEIVHDAATNSNIEVITSNLRYYLTFILNGLIEFLINSPVNTNLDEMITIDDYFILQELQLNSFREQKTHNLKDLLRIENPVEIFS